jgi:hypothetical protein
MPMRFPLILLAVLIAACSNDLTPGSTSVRATSLVLTPASATIDTATTLQVQSALAWADGATHPATITLSATGGTISASGLYKAGSSAGRYLVIAICTCGLTDTLPVTVTAPVLSSPTLAMLTLSITGLPGGKPGELSLSGPGGYHLDVTTSTTVNNLTPGTYSVQATTAMAGTDLYAPTPAAQSITLAASDVKAIQFSYSKMARPASISLSAHPRVWMTPARVTQLQVQAASNTVRWQRVKAAADAQVAKGTSVTVGSSSDEVYLGHLCMAYLGTGNQAYATRAGLILAAYAVEGMDNNLMGDSEYGYRFNLPLVTMGLDWCYNGLTVAQRQQTATWLMNRADFVWPESNPSRAGAWGVADYEDNYYYGFMMTGPAALAAAGDDTGTGTISGADRPTYHQTLALGKWNNTVVPFLASIGVGGGWTEGTNYGVGDTWYVGRFVDAFLTAGAPLDNTWFTAAVNWLMYTTMPGNTFKVPFGDQPRTSNAQLFTYDRLAMLDIVSAAKLDPTTASQAQSWLNLIGEVPTSEIGVPSVLTDELLHYDPSQPAASDLSGLNKDYLARGDGAFIYRQSWIDASATALAFRSGPNDESHGGLDANNLLIWKGSFWVAGDANIYSASGTQHSTDNYSTLMVGGVGQVANDANGGQIVGSPQVSDQLVVVRGQAANAYGPPSAHFLSDYLRTVAYLPQQDVFVVVDRVTANDASQAKVWRWQVQGNPQLSGNSFLMQNPDGSARCVGNVLSPTTATLGYENYSTSGAVTVTLPTGNATDMVVTVLQCFGSASQAQPSAPTVTTSAAGVVVTIGIKKVTVPSDQTQLVSVETAYIQH